MPTVFLPGPLSNVQARGKSRPNIKVSPEAHHSPEKEDTAQTWAWREIREGSLEEAMPTLKLKFQVGKQRGGAEHSQEDSKHKGRETRTEWVAPPPGEGRLSIPGGRCQPEPLALGPQTQ